MVILPSRSAVMGSKIGRDYKRIAFTSISLACK